VKPFYRNAALGPPKISPRARTLAAWRGVDTTPLERAAAFSAQPVATLIESAVNRLGLDRKRAEAEIVKVWNNTIDPTLAAHAQPTGLRHGTLFVSVDNSAWLDEIVRYRRKEILDRMQHSFGRDIIVRISFRVG
jgi:predicted nucleic acid-binding Zn ribbon protein